MNGSRIFLTSKLKWVLDRCGKLRSCWTQMSKWTLLVISVLFLVYVVTSIVVEPFENSDAKICFITAIYGSYEKECKPFKQQTVPTDFICFTDNPNLVPNGWKIDTTPYHKMNKSELDKDEFVNSLANNSHTFNVAKYYKQQFQNIPSLKHYDVIVWVDGTIELINETISAYLLEKLPSCKILGWEHEHRSGKLLNEVNASKDFFRYSSSFWNNQSQPIQDVVKQYNEYVSDGYNDSNFYDLTHPNKTNMGVWITCFVAFLNKDQEVTTFLNLWYEQTLKYTTQDQISFPYVCQKTKLIPYTLPDNTIHGEPHSKTDFYIKHEHNNTAKN